MTPLPLRLDQGCHCQVVCLLVTARDLPGRISTSWVTSQLAGLVSKSLTSIPFFWGLGSRPAFSDAPAAGQVSACITSLQSVVAPWIQPRTSPPCCPAAALPYLPPGPCLPGRSKSFTDLLKEPCTLTQGMPTQWSHALCAISTLQGWSFASARTFPVSPRGTLGEQRAANSKNMARMLWHTEKAIAGQD